MRVIGRFELLEPIGHGGMAVVHLARQVDLDRLVALKELRVLHSLDDPLPAERFLREARTAGSMSHANIVHVYEHFEHEGTPYIAMEYLKRGSLRPLVGRLTLAQIVGALHGVLEALEHAEQMRVVHRDLKPENLLVSEQGRIKVADFGIAKALTSTTAGLTAANTTLGTPAYMSPEQSMGRELGAYTDLYSLGVIAYELVIGRVPFEPTDTPLAVLMRHCNEEIPSAYTIDPEVARPLSDWIDRLLVKDTRQRTPRAEVARDKLEEVAIELLGARWQRDARIPVVPPVDAGPVDEQPAPGGSSGYVSLVLPPRRSPDDRQGDLAPEQPVVAPVTLPRVQPPVAPVTPPGVEPPAAPVTPPGVQPPVVLTPSSHARDAAHTIAPKPVTPPPQQGDPPPNPGGAAIAPPTGPGAERKDVDGDGDRSTARTLLPLLALLVLAVGALGAAAAMLLGGGGDGDGGDKPIVAATTATSGAAATATGAPKGRTVRIGGLYTLSGKSKDASDESLRGVQFALDYVNTTRYPDLGLALHAGAGLPALGGAKLALATQDAKDRCGAEAAFERLVGRDRAVAVIGAYESTVTLRAIVAADRLRVPLVNDTATAPGLTDAATAGKVLTGCGTEIADPTPSKWFARVGPDDRQFAALFGRFIADRAKAGEPVRKVAILYEDRDSYGEAGRAATKTVADGRGIDVEEFPYDSNLATATAGSGCRLTKLVDVLDRHVRAIARTRPDAVFALSYLPDAVTTVQLMKKIGYSPPALLAFGAGYADPAFVGQVRAANDACGLPAADPDGIITRGAFSAEDGAAKRASELFAKRYGHAMSDIAARSFTTTLALAQAIDAAGSTDPAKIRRALRALRVPDAKTIVPGGIAFAGSGQNTEADGVLLQILDGAYEVVYPEGLAAAAAVWPLAGAR